MYELGSPMVFGGLFKPNVEKMRRKKDLRGLARALKYEKDWMVRSEAAEALGSMGQDAVGAVMDLKGVLRNDPVSVVLEKAASALGKIDASSLVEEWIRILRLDHFPSRGSPEGWSNYWAIRKVLISIGPNAVFFLREALKNKSDAVRRHAVGLIGDLGTDAKEALPDLMETLKDEAEDVQEEAIITLGKIGEDAVPLLIDVLRRDKIEVRHRAIRALEAIGPNARDAAPAMVEASRHERLRLKAVEALGKIGSDAKVAVPPLLEALKDEDWRVRKQAIEALGDLGPDAEDAVPALMEVLNEALNNMDVWVRYTAKALGRIGPPKEAILVLVQRLNETEWWHEQEYIIEALGELGPAVLDMDGAHAAISKLFTHEYYYEHDYSIPKSVREALSKMGFFSDSR